MLSRMQVTLLLGFVTALWVALLLAHGEPIKWQLLAPFPSVVSGLVVGLVIFDSWLWKWSRLHPWLVPFQDLSGTWRGSLQTEWVNPKTLQLPGPIEVFLVITQTYSTLSMRLLTAESASELIVGRIIRADDGVSDLAGIYRNVPTQSIRQSSAIHHGALRLRLEGVPVSSLVGDYWTDRDTKGEIRLTARVPSIAHGFEHARGLFSATPTAPAAVGPDGKVLP